MAVKKATTKKAVKNAPAKKAVAKKATVKKVAKKSAAKRVPAKKTTAKKAVAKKAVAKKLPVKKATAKKVAKKSPVKKATVKKATVKKATVKKSISPSASSRQVFDSLAPIPEFKVASKRSPLLSNSRPAQPTSAAQSVPLPNQKTNSGKNKRGVILLVVVLLFGGAYVLINGGSESGTTSAPTPVATPTESATPASSEVATVEPTPTDTASEEPTTSIGTVSASYLYTSTGIRLSWKVSGAAVDSVEVSKSEDGGAFSTLSRLMADDRALRIMKIDTKGQTRFRVTITSTSGESFSTTVAIRGRFTL